MRIPGKGCQEGVQTFRGIPEACEVLSQHDYDIGAQPLGVGDALQLEQTTAARLIVACDEELLLLDREGQRLEGGGFLLEDTGIEAILGMKKRVSSDA